MAYCFLDEAVAFSETTGFWERDRITFRRPDTENGVIRHFSRREGGYLQDGYRQACWYLRDAKDNNSVAKDGYTAAQPVVCNSGMGKDGR